MILPHRVGRYRPVIGTEIEFYLFGSGGRALEALWATLRQEFPVFKIEKERGHEQWEISLTHTHNIYQIISDTERLKTRLATLAVEFSLRADFSAKPLKNDHGSGLHVHVHLEDEAGRNMFYKDDERMSDPLAHSIGGLLAKMSEHMRIFAPTPESRQRFVAGSNAPMTPSWGANNRTCAIRLPDKPRDNKHIEHRVSGADADVASVVVAVLEAIAYGLEHRILPPPQIYGDASLPMYGLPRLIAE